ncbi:Rv3235 family protein [Streptomyces sp. NPDC059445]|uniref:Rv3235 family protein n=1 Tax=Streptomyces sp. NPDC059445 TaxID=3346832 RepID=UPI0036A0DAC2
MNKVMTRTRRHPGTRPPGRQDSRRPGGAPPRTPGTGTPARRPTGTPPQDTTPAPAPSAGPPRGEARPGTPRLGEAARTGGEGRTSGEARTGTPRLREAARTGREGRTGGEARTGTPRLREAAGTGREGRTGGEARTGVLAAGAAGTPATAAAGAPVRPAPGPRPTDVFAERLLAVLSGARPVHCMLRHTAGRAYDELVRLAERGPLRTRGARPVVRDIGYYVARPDAVEAFARIGAGDQLRAMAFRLEQGPDLRWRCTAIELGIPRTPHPHD